MNKIYLYAVISVLVILNIFSLFRINNQKYRLSNFERTLNNLEQLIQRFEFQDSIFYSENLFKYRNGIEGPFKLIVIIPDKSCRSCLQYDQDIITSLQKKYPEYISIYYVTDNPEESYIKKLNPEFDYSFIGYNNEIFDSKNVIPPFKNLTYLLIDNDYRLISMHTTDWYQLEKSDLFVSKVMALFKDIDK